jgi:hypothetical protein
MILAPNLAAISGVASVDPVSTTTVSSTAPDRLERQRWSTSDSFRTIRQAEMVTGLIKRR